jgi:hypothetical protein
MKMRLINLQTKQETLSFYHLRSTSSFGMEIRPCSSAHCRHETAKVNMRTGDKHTPMGHEAAS